MGRSGRAEPHTPPRASCDFVHHSPPASPSPCPKRSSRPWRAAPRRIPSRGHQAEGAGVFRGSSPAPSPAQGSQVCCVGWLQLSATEDRFTGAASAPTGALFNVSFHGFPSNWLIHSFLDWGGFVSTLKLQRKSLGKSSRVPGGSSSQTPAPGPGGASALLVFLLQARPGLNTGLRARL